MGKKKVAVEPVKKPTFRLPPETVNEHFDLAKGVRMEAVPTSTLLTMRPAPKEKKEKKHNPHSKEHMSDYKKKLYLKKTLGWYYYLPKSMRPVPKLSSAVAAVNADDDDGVVSATKARNKMLLCEACAEGKWDQVRGPMRVHCWWRR